MGREKTLVFLRKYTMVIVLILVTLFFTWKTGGRMLLPQNVNNLIAQNAYVFILATGMLLCILTGGNIDLSVGSIVCFVGAIGGNEKAAQLSGINTNKVYFFAYANMGLLAAFAAMVTIARLNSANPTAGDGYEMDAIGSCFIGGASAYGGSGTIPGVIIGATLMGVINLGMSIMGVDANWQKVVKGAVLLAAVIFDVETKKNKS